MNIHTPNNPVQFQGLKGIQFKRYFQPDRIYNREQPKIVEEFKNSPAFKKFFEKNDGIATFDQFLSPDKKTVTLLTIDLVENFPQRLLRLISDTLSGKEHRECRHIYLSSKDAFASDSEINLIEKINKATIESLNKSIE